MLNITRGKPLCVIEGGPNDNEIIFLDTGEEYSSDSEDSTEESKTVEGYEDVELKRGKLRPLLDYFNRQVSYIAGPSGSGKTTYAVNLAKGYKKIYPDREIYLFSRTDRDNDPAFDEFKPIQIILDEQFADAPLDIEKDIEPGSLLLFDDITTISDKKIRDAVFHLMSDVMEVGRKLELYIIITNHLVNPNDRKLGRTILNELQVFTFFPKSGSAYQIKYCLEKYFGLDKKQIEKILRLPSRWVTVYKSYPQIVMYDRGIYTL